MKGARMPRAGLSTEVLVRSGAELADEVGFEQVTLSALARRHGVKLASLYGHIANSNDLKRRICRLALAEMAERGAVALAGRAGKDALLALGEVYRRYAQEHPGRYRAGEFRLDPSDAVASAGPRHTQMARAVLRGYGLPEPEQTHAVRLMGSVFRGFVNLELAGGFSHSEPGSDESWTWALDALDAMLRSREGAAARPARPAGESSSEAAQADRRSS
jgi:AcrR family transcriptional regulator